ncbi:MAG: class I SAM-dependent methyltransferase [Nannocystaceae bacterium]
MSLVSRLDALAYPGVANHWDDELLRARVLARLRADAVVLDLGAGAGIVRQMDLRGHAARICGVDLDPRVVDNPFLDEAKVADGASIPYDDATFDVVVADNVLEHLDDPTGVLREVARVLRPGGSFLFKTPNRRHYMPLIARMTPLWFHRAVNRLRGREVVDTFPTRYRVNTPADVRRHASASGLEVASIELLEGRPEYTRISAPTYLVGIAYERLVNASDALAGLRVVLLGELRRPG